MKIPPKTMIAEHEVKVLLRHGGEFSKRGEWNGWYKEIRINNDGTTEDSQAEIFMHEIFEGINDIFDLGLDHKTITQLIFKLYPMIGMKSQMEMNIILCG